MIETVLGAAIGYTREQVRPFLKSLRMTGYTGRIVWFADKGGADEARDWGAEVLPCPKVKTKPHAERFYWMLEEMSKRDLGPTLCLDTRDVFFQTNPAHLPDTGLHVFEEDECMTIGSCPYNSLWVKIGMENWLWKS